jgi:hypothetical protein
MKSSSLDSMVLTSLVGAAKNETNAMPKIAASKPKTMSTAGAHRPAAKMCNEASQGIHHDGSSFAENSWIPKNRNEQGTTKDPEEPAPRVGDKVEFFRIATVLLTNGFCFLIDFFAGHHCRS